MNTDLPIPNILARIDSWYFKNTPAIHASLRSGSNSTALDTLEILTGFTLPQSFRELYKWHDGQKWIAGGLFGLEFLPLERVVSIWQGQQIGDDMGYRDVIHPPNSTQDVFSSPGWLGFLGDQKGNYIGLDFSPGKTGKIGQVINFGYDQGDRYVIADSLDDFLREYLQRLETGRVTVAHTLDHDYFETEENYPVWYVGLHDSEGNSTCMEKIYVLADLFPDFSKKLSRP